ncbi:4-diphosphocytidyl-2C-methyl-D-erythritol kinase (IspE) (PDB:1OJ4) [Commensalibacter communis]|uniref:4-diphosphocytidyl-2-C-methyl-D-erythritol kinase n=1 Tax=Commensalibacter communis TaxID=2972786 RepID=A0A9W4X5F5_9PROT|nr:4-(cytidine 5'-diphospho)-2-C-methyl-D-erythritol kinase [Commensalibacter communis]CAI3922141.1 4-diphosphocytidyl-2C-methyl-D-erythritol kinase (IspE) (PDB:1OJ4) [Commensalibacter communis]CAI3922695.1 4-diphosphocytidyl-2C-methyl-D-erythritol kinase (IspE) (PDB:1OJ4) [Commensalibacter communis]CAI3939973.1 4-diphosphocytidyl-2C-methyl-D-erythritol kinase (IspE) (PDB:1OJ4) [Commensalibacter communis]CAI3940543.1 4-diphosphocytidyl-2C-methyl-D-erythritol kinase (IspE) (PDB:1OJ4) [Commensali
MEEKAYAKINLNLHVTGKREDGYHLLDSLVVFPDVGDRVIVMPAKAGQTDLVNLQIVGPFSASLQNEDLKSNLIVKAAYQLSALAKKELSPVNLILEKNLPVASGIGGGSSDAAATLRVLINYWNIEISSQELAQLALKLGADVPVCLTPVAQRMEGIGETLSLLPELPRFGMVLVNHGEAVSTAEIFRKRDAQFSKHLETINSVNNFELLIQELLKLTNDLQLPACALNPKITTVLQSIEQLPFCRLSRMSGSGATCFGLFETAQQANEAAILLAQQHSWWIWGGEGNIK